jgi:CRISPR/Cas system-associated exonuclease Cas4 (RecB family)
MRSGAGMNHKEQYGKDSKIDYELPKFNPADPFTIPEPLGDLYCVSPSKILDYDHCPAKYLLGDVFKIKTGLPEPDWGAILGKEVHDWHDKTFHRPYAFNELEGLFYELPETTIFERECKNLVRAELRYLDEHRLDEMHTVGTEVMVSSWENRRTGYTDRLELRPDGNLTVVEVKPKVNWKYPKSYRFQLTFYANQINWLLDNETTRFKVPKGARVTHLRVIGYRDASQVEWKLNSRTTTAIEKRVKGIRKSTYFPCNYGSNLCKYCPYIDSVCMEANK